MARSDRNLIIFGLVSALLFIGLYYYGFVYSFRNYGEMGNGYPLATYEIPSDLERTKAVLDSICKTKRYSINSTVNNDRRLPDRLSIVYKSGGDSIVFDIEFESQSSFQKDRTKLFLLGVTHNERTVFYKSVKKSDESFVSRLKSKLEIEVIEEMK